MRRNIPILDAARKSRTDLCTPPEGDPVGSIVLGSVEYMTAEFRRRADIVREWIRSGLCPSCGGSHVMPTYAEEGES